MNVNFCIKWIIFEVIIESIRDLVDVDEYVRERLGKKFLMCFIYCVDIYVVKF